MFTPLEAAILVLWVVLGLNIILYSVWRWLEYDISPWALVITAILFPLSVIVFFGRCFYVGFLAVRELFYSTPNKPVP